MKERNRASLERALRQLPEYEPAEQTWQHIAGQLQESPLHAAINHLPAYDPSPATWEGIAAALDTPAAGGRGRPGPLLRYAAAVAALVFIGAGSWYFTATRNAAPSVEIVYSEEWVDEPSLENDWEQDDAVFREVEALLSASPLLQGNAEYHSLQQELQELEDARQAIEELMKSYGQDPNLIREMGKLERARTDLLQEMVAMI